MRISVNLATRPFVELRPFFARLRLIMAGMAVLAVGLLAAQHVEQKRLESAQAQMDELRSRTIAAQREKLNNEATMRRPANAAVLQRAHFLNALFLSKSFSWTAVMMDLENVLPTGVQVTAIEPAITSDGDVVIRLRVAGDRDRAIQLVRNLERSTRFIAPRLAAETTQTREQAASAAAAGGPPAGVEFDIFANYNPLAAASAVAAGSMIRRAVRGASSPVAGPQRQKTVKPGPNDGVVLKPYVAPRAAGQVPGGTR